MASERGGSVHWSVYAPDGSAVDGTSGRRDGVPPWNLVAALARKDGGLTVVY